MGHYDLHPGMDESRKQMLAHFFKNQRKRLNKCLSPSMQCPKPAIQAHTVQNARVLELIASEGHVIGFKQRIDKKRGPIIELRPLGRNEATTFSGHCAEHDVQMFRSIDTDEISTTNKKQLFLLAYRSVLRGLHSTMDAAIKLQIGYRKRVEAGWDPENKPTPSGIVSTEQMLKAWLVYRYKYHLDQMYIDSDFRGLEHVTRLLEQRSPTIAMSAFFSIGAMDYSDDIKGISVNVLPMTKSSTLVLVSYLSRDRESVGGYLGNMFDMDEEDFTYRLSRMILEKTETIVISPAYYGKWSRKKKMVVENFFRATLFDEDQGQRCPVAS